MTDSGPRTPNAQPATTQSKRLSIARWLFGPGPRDGPGYLWPRWLWLRALGLILFSAFYSFIFQVRGLIGPEGILPARDYLKAVDLQWGALRFWYAPTLLWLGSGNGALKLLCWAGIAAAILLTLNLWPRGMTAVCLLCFGSLVSAARDFSDYQSDGMLLAAGFLSFFFAPPGLRPRLGDRHPPSRASRFMLQWLWFRIYFGSGIVKMASGEPQWRHLTAMDQYYQNGPLPNWIGWYAQQLPHAVQASIALTTLIVELGLVWMLFLPRRFRILCFCIVTPFQIGIILTANLAFLNHFVLALGFLLLDDRVLRDVFMRIASKFGIRGLEPPSQDSPEIDRSQPPTGGLATDAEARTPEVGLRAALLAAFRHVSLFVSGFCLTWIFYNTTALLLMMLEPALPLPMAPVVALEPFRISEQYGLFAVMTTARYEIEFQGTRDGKNWVAYPFRYKPQDPRLAPRLYAPYQPRFDWNLWFASLGGWRQYPWVLRTEVLLLRNDSSVLSLFAGNPFDSQPPEQVRAVVWQYWFTDLATKRGEGLWWRREYRGLYAPALALGPDGRPFAVETPEGQ